MLKHLALALGIAATSLGSAYAQEKRVPVTLTTGWIFEGPSAGIILADSKGYFKEGNVDVQIVRGFGSTDVITKVAAGTYQAGTGYLPALVRAIAENPDLDAIAVMVSYDASPDGIVGPLASGISKPADLVGRKISSQPNSTTRLVASTFFKAVGVDGSTIKWVEVSPDLIGVVVKDGQAEAAAQFVSGAVANFQKLGIPEDKLFKFKFSDFVPNLYGNGLILRKSWAKANPEAAKTVVRAYARGLRDAYASPKSAIDALMAREPLLTRAVEEPNLTYANANFYFTPNVLAKGLAYHSESDITSFIKNLVEPFGLKRVPAASEVYTNAYLPAASELTVPK